MKVLVEYPALAKRLIFGVIVDGLSGRVFVAIEMVFSV